MSQQFAQEKKKKASGYSELHNLPSIGFTITLDLV